MNDKIKEQDNQNEARPNASEGAHDRLLGDSLMRLHLYYKYQNDNYISMLNNEIFMMTKGLEHMCIDYSEIHDEFYKKRIYEQLLEYDKIIKRKIKERDKYIDDKYSALNFT